VRRVLVVDPDASFRALIALVLEIEGFTVLTAGSMAEALKIARRAHPDVISINVGAPGLHGWSLSRQLRADSATASTRQMIVDGSGAVADGVPARVDAVLTGRADTAGFAEALRRVLRRPPEGAQPHPLAADLDAVLERRLIRPLFQPIVDLDSGDVVGVEALARGPAGPLHTPMALFEVANQVDRLHELDSLCRLTAITTARDAAAHAPPLVFVNVEPGTVDLPMSAELRAVLSRDLPFQIVVEFTERALTRRLPALLRHADEIRARGSAVALDDIGVDPRSVAVLPLVQPEIVKLDMSLLAPRLPAHATAAAAAVEAYAVRNGAVVVAEASRPTSSAWPRAGSAPGGVRAGSSGAPARWMSWRPTAYAPSGPGCLCAPAAMPRGRALPSTSPCPSARCPCGWTAPGCARSAASWKGRRARSPTWAS